MHDYRKRQSAIATLRELVEHPENVLIVHYSCESLADKPDGSSARVTSIAVQNLKTRMTASFSIHHLAERHRVTPDELEGKLDDLEKELLTEFYDFVGRNEGRKWAHWNMRDTTYGFPALEHRFRVLGGEPKSIPTERLFDIGRLMPARYGSKYIGHPRLEKIIELNGITSLDLLPGAEEATAFAEREFVRLHKSTLRKVSCIGTIVDHAAGGKLKTLATWSDRHGFSWRALPFIARDHPSVIVLGLIGLVLGIAGVSMKDCSRFGRAAPATAPISNGGH